MTSLKKIREENLRDIHNQTFFYIYDSTWSTQTWTLKEKHTHTNTHTHNKKFNIITSKFFIPDLTLISTDVHKKINHYRKAFSAFYNREL